jgi:RNA polymerase sigma-70 factor (ECF subfamily)
MPTTNGQSDAFIPTRQSLLSRLRDFDDTASWRDFFDTYWKLIYRAAVKAGLSDADAQDVVQDTIITVSRRIGAFRYDSSIGSFKGWLLQATRWRILSHLRKRNRGLPIESLPAELGDENPLESIPDPAGEQIEALWKAEWQQNLMDAAIQRVKRQVKPKHYQIFELNALRKWPATKTARVLGVNTAQVHLIKHRIGALIKKEVKRLEAKGI